jgi:oligopeptide/dipeptide ABC transporter ATP-binding protein
VVHYLSDQVMVMYLGQIVEIGPVERIYGHAVHPYTQALLSAVPSMDPAHRTLASPISGDPPNPIDPPSGCRFFERCPQAHARCQLQAPRLLPVAGDTLHQVACHLNDPQADHADAVQAVPSAQVAKAAQVAQVAQVGQVGQVGQVAQVAAVAHMAQGTPHTAQAAGLALAGEGA